MANQDVENSSQEVPPNRSRSCRDEQRENISGDRRDLHLKTDQQEQLAQTEGGSQESIKGEEQGDT